MPKTASNPTSSEHREGSVEHRLNEQFRQEQMAIYKARLQKEKEAEKKPAENETDKK